MAATTIEPSVAFLDDLRSAVRGEIRADRMSRALYATDASIYKIMPVAVLIPQTEQDVAAAVRIAARHNVSVLPRGGGSSLAGQAVGQALVLDFSTHLDAILDINPGARTVRVQAGAVVDHVNTALGKHGLMLGPDPASGNRATIGGIVANNATGTHSLLYGNTVQHVERMRVVLADGTITEFAPTSDLEWFRKEKVDSLEGRIYAGLSKLLSEKREIIERDTPKHWRRNNGYRIEHLLDGVRNPARLICGSEGTLGVVLDVTLKAVPKPAMTAVGIVHFETRRESLQSVTEILKTDPSAIELFDGVAIEQARNAPGFADKLTFIEGRPGAVLITEYFGDDADVLAGKVDELRTRMDAKGLGYGIFPVLTAGEIKNVWDVRKEGLGLVMGVKGDYKPLALVEDASVPVEHLADYIDDLEAVFERTDTRSAMYAHASSGCLHVRPFLNLREESEVTKMRDIAWASMELARKYGGVVSSEHGDGIVRAWLTEPLVGKDLYEVYRDVKHIFDPDDVLNPGKVVDPLPMTENLRISPSYRTVPFAEELDWSADGGFAASVELCNGNGACRKLQSGTMCPSFMVTRDEEHSTRGRANALRSVLSGEVPPEELTGKRMYEVMDLCIQCKGCKTECPSNVDMGRMKTEWLSKYWQKNTPPLRTRLFAHMPRIARRLNNRGSSITNWVNNRTSVKALLERSLKISSKRKMPVFATETFHAWFEKQTWRTDGPEVVLFADTFNTFNHIEAACAAAELLDRAGYQVRVPHISACCGRTYLSKGFIKDARTEALNTLDRLAPYVEAGMPVVGLEPSCILTFKDEFLALLPGDPRAKKLAALTFTFEQFVARKSMEGEFDVNWTDEPRHILLHGHCHQKAHSGTTPTVAALTLPPNYTVEVVDSGCCGMAGAFGYEKEHYDISIRMAERRLAPAVRSAAAETLIAAPGTSCQTQILDTTSREALHPAVILRQALAD
jgi:FAD/FMN-containing dehydrogenase/Fe-S oxidoreductase